MLVPASSKRCLVLQVRRWSSRRQCCHGDTDPSWGKLRQLTSECRNSECNHRRDSPMRACYSTEQFWKYPLLYPRQSPQLKWYLLKWRGLHQCDYGACVWLLNVVASLSHNCIIASTAIILYKNLWERLVSSHVLKTILFLNHWTFGFVRYLLNGLPAVFLWPVYSDVSLNEIIFWRRPGIWCSHRVIVEAERQTSMTTRTVSVSYPTDQNLLSTIHVRWSDVLRVEMRNRKSTATMRDDSDSALTTHTRYGRTVVSSYG